MPKKRVHQKKLVICKKIIVKWNRRIRYSTQLWRRSCLLIKNSKHRKFLILSANESFSRWSSCFFRHVLCLHDWGKSYPSSYVWRFQRLQFSTCAMIDVSNHRMLLILNNNVFFFCQLTLKKLDLFCSWQKPLPVVASYFLIIREFWTFTQFRTPKKSFFFLYDL